MSCDWVRDPGEGGGGCDPFFAPETEVKSYNCGAVIEGMEHVITTDHIIPLRSFWERFARSQVRQTRASLRLCALNLAQQNH